MSGRSAISISANAVLKNHKLYVRDRDCDNPHTKDGSSCTTTHSMSKRARSDCLRQTPFSPSGLDHFHQHIEIENCGKLMDCDVVQISTMTYSRDEDPFFEVVCVKLSEFAPCVRVALRELFHTHYESNIITSGFTFTGERAFCFNLLKHVESNYTSDGTRMDVETWQGDDALCNAYNHKMDSIARIEKECNSDPSKIFELSTSSVMFALMNNIDLDEFEYEIKQRIHCFERDDELEIEGMIADEIQKQLLQARVPTNRWNVYQRIPRVFVHIHSPTPPL
jgi:hypothetical protein